MDIRTKFAESLINAGALDKVKTELRIILASRPGFVGARIRIGVVLGTTRVRFASGNGVRSSTRRTCVLVRTSHSQV
jgi:hypothetical protein